MPCLWRYRYRVVVKSFLQHLMKSGLNQNMSHPILHPKQRAIIKSDSRFKVIRAGRRSGKTTLEIERMCFDAVSKKDRNIFYLAPTQTQAREIIWEALRKRLHDVGQFNEQRLEVKVPTIDKGFSLIKLSGWENRENFRGKAGYRIVFDETDTMKDFFMSWQDIFRPALMDSEGFADFIGTPKKENPNLRRLEKLAETDTDFTTFHFTSFDNPYLPRSEQDKIEEEYKDNKEAYRQEILAEYVDNLGSLFKYDALIDVFSNTIVKENSKYLLVDIADDGSDKTIFSFWEGLQEYRREEFVRLNTEMIVNKIREYATSDTIPYSHIAVDAIGVGAGVASSSMLDGIIGYKSSYQAIKTDISPVQLPNVSYVPKAPSLVSDYKNLRSQCLFTLADKINNHQIASLCTGRQKEVIIEELATYQDASIGDGKRMATQKEDVKQVLGRSPDNSDTWIMRMYFVIKGRMDPEQSEHRTRIVEQQKELFNRNKRNIQNQSTR